MSTIEWPPRAPERRGRPARFVLVALAAVILLGGGTLLTYYVESLWFESLGFGAVFWKSLSFQGRVFLAFTLATFLLLYGSFLAIKPSRLSDLTGPILINGQAIQLPVSVAATAANWLGGTLDVGLCVALAVGLAFGTWLGAKAAHTLPAAGLRKAVAAVLVVVGSAVLLRIGLAAANG